MFYHGFKLSYLSGNLYQGEIFPFKECGKYTLYEISNIKSYVSDIIQNFL